MIVLYEPTNELQYRDDAYDLDMIKIWYNFTRLNNPLTGSDFTNPYKSVFNVSLVVF